MNPKIHEIDVIEMMMKNCMLALMARTPDAEYRIQRAHQIAKEEAFPREVLPPDLDEWDLDVDYTQTKLILSH